MIYHKLKYAELHSQIKKIELNHLFKQHTLTFHLKRYFHEIFFDILILLNKETITKEQ